MQQSDAPDKLPLPFADAGGRNAIPVDSQIGIVNGAASLTDGFPPLTRVPTISGGIPPFGLDMNGILYEVSAIVRWANAGGGYEYDGTFANDSNVNGYPKGARIQRTDGQGYWLNTVDDNVTNPESSPVGWVPDYTYGASAITMTNANVTLTPLQYGKPVVVISGLLTANLNLIFPAIVGEWVVINNCTGSYSITCKTASGTGIPVSIATVQQVIGDGTNVLAPTLPSQPGRLIGVQTYLASTTYTKTPGTNFAIIEAQGGGGGGGAVIGSLTATVIGASNGGMAGSYAMGKFTSGFNGLVVTVGAGGVSASDGETSSFGTLVVAPGGKGGLTFNSATPPFVCVSTVLPSAPTGGNLATLWSTEVQPGYGFQAQGGGAISGAGGASRYGTGGTSKLAQFGVGLIGSDASNAGSGGGGAVAFQVTGTFAGGQGAGGFVRVWEYS